MSWSGVKGRLLATLRARMRNQRCDRIERPSRSIELGPLLEFLKTELLERVHEGAAGLLMPAHQPVILVNHVRQPFGDGEAFVFAVRHRVQESLPDVFPVMLRDPAALR